MASWRSRPPFDDFAARLPQGVNPYVLELMEGAATLSLPVLYGPFLAGLAGRWRSTILEPAGDNLSRRLFLEIGCHLGHTLASLAAAHPKEAFVGLDITFKRAVRTAKRCQKADLKNVRAVLADACFLPQLFEPGELSGIIAFFPDPWEKKARQARHRLFTADFLNEMTLSLERNGFFWFKTDSSAYFSAVTGFMQSQLCWRPESVPESMAAAATISPFERLFTEQGRPVFSGFWRWSAESAKHKQ